MSSVSDRRDLELEQTGGSTTRTEPRIGSIFTAAIPNINVFRITSFLVGKRGFFFAS